MNATINDLRRFLLGQRVRLQLLDLASDGGQDEEGVLDDIDELARQQIAPWACKKFDKATVLDHFALLNRAHPCVHVLRIEGGRITIAAKPPFFVPPSERLQLQRVMRSYSERIHCYRIFLEQVIAASRLDLNMTIAVNADDIGVESQIAPLFAFQKKAGGLNILFPDIDFFRWNWYRSTIDRVPYDKKKISAGFAGASTGGPDGAFMVNAGVIKEGLNPRLRAAAYFAGSKIVDFRISKAVQVDRPETKALIESQPYFSRPVSYRTLFRHRFLISMDGNGAAWSRVAIALKSQGALIKYESPYVLYYFSKMMPGRDYISVSSEEEVLRAVEAEQARPGFYREIAEASRDFFARYLERGRVVAYTALLLQRYANLYASMA
jgi:hypothetical protein